MAKLVANDCVHATIIIRKFMINNSELILNKNGKHLTAQYFEYTYYLLYIVTSNDSIIS